jgi:hypothetical protein
VGHVRQQRRVVADQGRVALVPGDREVGVAAVKELLGGPGERRLGGGRTGARPGRRRPGSDEQDRGHEHGGQGDQPGQGEGQSLAGEAVGQMGVAVAGAEPGPEGGGQRDRRPAGGEGAGGQGAGGAAGDPEGPGPVGVGAAQPDQAGEHHQVGQGEQRDGQGQGGAEVAAVVVAGDGEGGQGGDGGDQAAG